MTKRRRRKDSRRSRKQAQAGRGGDARTPFLDTPAGRLVMIALAILGLWLLVLAVYIASR